MKNEEIYYPSANWAFIKGNYTPEELLKIIEEIEEKHKEFKKNQG